MKKLLRLTKSLLVVALLGMGTSSAWALNKKTIFSADFETGEATDYWQRDIGAIFTNKASNTTSFLGIKNALDRGDYFLTAGTYPAESYTIELDFFYSKGSKTANFAVMSESAVTSEGTGTGNWVPNYGYNWANGNSAAAHNAYLFFMSMDDGGLEAVINEDAEDTFTFTDWKWWHLILTVNPSTHVVAYSFYQKDNTANSHSGSYTLQETDGVYESANCKGVYVRNNRYNYDPGTFGFDNVDIYYMVDEEVVSAPSISDPVYAGDNRTVTITGGTSSNGEATVKTYYTLDGIDPTNSSTEYTGAITITEDCTVKAITISSTGVASTIDNKAVTVGKLTLVAPTITKTAYASNKYTVKIDNDQSSLAFVPASSTLYYAINGGAVTVYSNPFEVTEGSSVKAYVTADNYTQSADTDIEAGVMPSYPVDYSQNYVGIVGSDVTLSYDGSDFSNCIVSNVGDTYVVYSSDGTNASANANIGFYVNNASNPRTWMVRPTGGMYNLTATTVAFGIANVKAGQVIKIEWAHSSYGDVYVNSGITMIDEISYGSVGYYTVNTSGTVYFNAARNVYIKNIYVYNTTVPVTLDDAGYATLASAYPLDLRTANMGGATAYKAEVSGTTVRFNTIDQTVAANTGILLKGDASVTYNIPVVASGTAVAENAFLVNEGGTMFDADDDYYYFAMKKNAAQLTFNTFAPGTLAFPASKAYLKVAKSNFDGGAPQMTFIFGDDATGISSVGINSVAAGKAVFNLQGQRVAELRKGLYIVGGKKVVIK